MDKAQAKKFMDLLSELYPNYALTTTRVEFWMDCLGDIGLDVAMKRLKIYSKGNKFPPTIADITNPLKKAQEKVNAIDGMSPAQKKQKGQYETYLAPPGEFIFVVASDWEKLSDEAKLEFIKAKTNDDEAAEWLSIGRYVSLEGRV